MGGGRTPETREDDDMENWTDPRFVVEGLERASCSPHAKTLAIEAIAVAEQGGTAEEWRREVAARHRNHPQWKLHLEEAERCMRSEDDPADSQGAARHNDQDHRQEDSMSHVAIADAAAAVAIQPGAVVSKVIHRNEDLNVTVFGFDAGEGLTEHQASRAAIVQVMAGRLRFVADGEELDAGPGFWLHMTPGTPHSLVAAEPTVMLLTLVGT